MNLLEAVTEVDDGSMPFGAKLICGVIVLVIVGIYLLHRFNGSGRPPR